MRRTSALPVAILVCIVWLGFGTSGAAQARAVGAYTTKGAWSYWSSPLHPPKLQADKPVASSQLERSGYFMTANFYNLNSPTRMIGQSGPLIFNNKLQPVWFRPVGTKLVANNLEVQRYEGQPVLSWWQGVVTNVGVTVSGEYVVVNQHYKQVATLTGKDGWVLSLDDFRISGHDAWVTAYKVVPNQNLTQFGGSASGSVLDVAVQEYDLTNGELLFNWDALNHGGTPNIPLTQSQQKPYGGTPWDAYHLNSIQLIGSNEFLVSMRNTSSVYLVQVNGGTGKIKWTLSGDPQLSIFRLPKDAEFSWQHDVELLPNDEVSLFDDRCCAVLRPGMFARPSGPARGLILKLNMGKHTAALVGQYPRADNFDVFFLGSTQLLSNGNVLVGWGSQPYFTQFSKKGKVLLDVRWPGPDVSYRVLRHGWVGLPEYPPSGAVRKSNGKTTVYASWNGATRLAAWRVLSGFSKTHLSLTVKRSAARNFETPIAITGTRTWFEVQALGSNGRVIGSSSPFTFASQPVRRLRALAATRSS